MCHQISGNLSPPTFLLSLPTVFLELCYKLFGIVKTWLVWARDVSNRKMALSSYSLSFSFLLIVFIRPFPAWRCSCVTQNRSSVVLLFLCHLLRSHHLFETVAKTLYFIPKITLENLFSSWGFCFLGCFFWETLPKSQFFLAIVIRNFYLSLLCTSSVSPHLGGGFCFFKNLSSLDSSLYWHGFLCLSLKMGLFCLELYITFERIFK